MEGNEGICNCNPTGCHLPLQILPDCLPYGGKDLNKVARPLPLRFEV